MPEKSKNSGGTASGEQNPGSLPSADDRIISRQPPLSTRPTIARQAAENCASLARQYDLSHNAPAGSATAIAASSIEADEPVVTDPPAISIAALAAAAAAAAAVARNSADAGSKTRIPEAAATPALLEVTQDPLPADPIPTGRADDQKTPPQPATAVATLEPAPAPAAVAPATPSPIPQAPRITAARLPAGLIAKLPPPRLSMFPAPSQPPADQVISTEGLAVHPEQPGLPAAFELKRVQIRDLAEEPTTAAVVAGPVFDPAQMPVPPSAAQNVTSREIETVEAPVRPKAATLNTPPVAGPAVTGPAVTGHDDQQTVGNALVLADAGATTIAPPRHIPENRRLPAPQKPATRRGSSGPAKSWPRRILRFGAYAIAGYALLCIILLTLYRVVDPPTSNLMLWQQLNGVDVQNDWVPLADISPNVIRAVIASEDAKFCKHRGVDFGAIREALKHAKNGQPRGASTISMQVTKNLFLWNSKSYVRKALEIPMTLLMELMWPKTRIIEIYLNIAEWGDGIFGIEAAADYHFGKPASRLSLRQASLLAASLPNPRNREAGAPDRRTRAIASRIAKRANAGSNRAGCVLPGRSRLKRGRGK